MAPADIIQAVYHRVRAFITPNVVATLAIAATNLKVLPFAWHIRILYGYFGHYALNRRGVPPSFAESLTLFQPTIYCTSLPVGELDHNMHKSNSTYLTDLDIARGYHIYSVFRLGAREYTRRGASDGTFAPALGGVTLSFRRPISPFQKYDIWTRLASWDGKWLYLVSHFVPHGTAMPAVFTDESASPVAAEPSSDNQLAGSRHSAQCGVVAPPLVYATAVSKVVMKQGRKTIPPEEFLRACNLFGQEAETHNGGDIRSAAEKRRLEGLRLAQCLTGLDSAFDLFTGDERVAFARY